MSGDSISSLPPSNLIIVSTLMVTLYYNILGVIIFLIDLQIEFKLIWNKIQFEWETNWLWIHSIQFKGLKQSQCVLIEDNRKDGKKILTYHSWNFVLITSEHPNL